MPVNLVIPDQIFPVEGVKLSTIEANIRYKDREDLVLIELAEGTAVSAVFTKSAFAAAPVAVCKDHLSTSNSTQYLLINSGNANAVTGKQGYDVAKATCKAVAKKTDCQTENVLPFSTGVIGEQLPLEKVTAKIPALIKTLDADNWEKAAKAIMTTDTQIKAVTKQLEINGNTVTFSGIAKGAGMIEPNMATMLAYIACDIDIPQSDLHAMMQEIADESFNRITVDGDTSTNDAFVIMATGKSGVNYSESNQEQQQNIKRVLSEFAQSLAQGIIRDAEGITKFVTIKVTDASNDVEAKEVAYSVARSPLVKTALFASDPNWGRLLMAIGKAPIENLNVSKLDLWLGDVQLLSNGQPSPSYTEEQGQSVMDQEEIDITIKMNTGDAGTQVWTSDLSHDYVSINADYRS